MPKARKLSDVFEPSKYLLSQANDGIHLTITGQRKGRPSKRLTLHSKGLKVISAGIGSKSKNKEFTYEVQRINHIPSFEEVRLHTSSLQFAGDFTLIIKYRGKTLEQIRAHLDGQGPYKLREHLPSIDELPDDKMPDITISK